LHKIIVIAKAEQATANTFCNSIGAEGNTFTVPLFTGETHTHYWCGWHMSEAQAQAVDAEFTHVYATPQEALSALGLSVGVDEKR
jgi:phosphoheptose isomerase